MTPEQELDVVAKIIFGEAWTEAGEDDIPTIEEAFKAVANTMRNRAVAEDSNVYTEATSPKQYSIYLKPKDPEYPNNADWNTLSSIIASQPKKWAVARAMAQQAINGTIEDNTGGATFYYNPKVVENPDFLPRTTWIKDIGNHKFLKDLNETDKYSDQKLQEKLKKISQKPTQLQTDIVPREEVIPQQNKNILSGTQKQINQQEEKKQLETFSEKVGQHSRSPLASERFKKALDAWTLTMNPDQKKIVQEYLPEHFEQGVNPSPYNKDFNYSSTLPNQEDLKVAAIQQYPFSQDAQDTALNIKTKYPSEGELALKSGALKTGIAGGVYEEGKAWLEGWVDKLSPDIYDKLPEWMRITLDNIKTKEKVSLKNPDPFVFTHELMHSLWGKMMPIGKGETTIESEERAVPFIDRFNQKWEEAKKQDKTLQRIDNDIQKNYEQGYLNSGALANERFAFLGSYVGPVGREAVPSQLRAYYSNVFSLKKPEKHSIDYGEYLGRQPKKELSTIPKLTQSTPMPGVPEIKPIEGIKNPANNLFEGIAIANKNPFSAKTMLNQKSINSPFKAF